MATSRKVPKPTDIETEVLDSIDTRPKLRKRKPKRAAKPNQKGPAKKKRAAKK